jgi:hypothetical protein
MTTKERREGWLLEIVSRWVGYNMEEGVRKEEDRPACRVAYVFEWL